MDLSIGSARFRRSLLFFALALLASSTAHAEVIYYHTDALGNPVVATNEQGQVIWRERYTPHGTKLLNQPAARTETRGFTGHLHDPYTGLTYMGARWYDPELGRFMGTDPKGFRQNDPHSFNPYVYANNNPYKYIDPDGREVVFSAATEPYLSTLMTGSATARAIMGELARSPTVYEFTLGNSNNPAFTEVVREGIWVKIAVNPSALKNWEERNESGEWFKVPVERAFAHEMGHAVLIDRDGSLRARRPAEFKKATEYENRIARELDPAAAQRDTSGDAHAGRWSPPPLLEPRNSVHGNR